MRGDDRRAAIYGAGCQYEIANQIVKGKGDYLFSLKGNQETLHEDVREYFQGLDSGKPAAAIDRHIRVNTVSAHGRGHGREEDRDYAASGDAG